jgi:oligopeptide/dipeptide ABC transporter ATP-binding protein
MKAMGEPWLVMLQDLMDGDHRNQLGIQLNNLNAEKPPLIEVVDLAVHFRVRRGLGVSQTVRAVDGVSFTLHAGETLGIAGESGSGKSTVARAMIRINQPTTGSVQMDGRETVRLSGKELKLFRRRIQMVYQDPYDSLDPRMRVREAIGEALTIQGISKSQHPETIKTLLERVNLPPIVASRFPSELSGGQRQRISIARALAVNPNVIICDEAVSALDVSIRAQILNLLKDIQADSHVGYLFISHDLSTLRFMADRVAIMYVGRIVEYGTRTQVFDKPAHPYTQSLLAAVPRIQKNRSLNLRLKGEPPDPANPPSGCPFHPRCPSAIDRCRQERPRLEEKINGQQVACHVVPSSLATISVASTQ